MTELERDSPVNARAIVQALKGHWYGSYGMARCPAHDDLTPSLSVRDGDDRRLLWRCHAGCDQSAVLEALQRRGLLDSCHKVRSESRRVKRRPTNCDDNARINAALKVWCAAQPATGTVVETYLGNRGIKLAVPPSIRYASNLEHKPSGLNFPAMIAAVQAADRRITGIHRTYLLPDGSGKARVMPPKMALGRLGNGAVRLGRAGPVLGVAEGIETSLAAMQLFELPVWCALGSRLSQIALPSNVRCVIIFADSGKAGLQAAKKAAKALTTEGRKVTLFLPDEGDFNDVLHRQGVA